MQCIECYGKGLKSATEFCPKCEGSGQSPDNISPVEEVKPTKVKVKSKK